MALSSRGSFDQLIGAGQQGSCFLDGSTERHALILRTRTSAGRLSVVAMDDPFRNDRINRRTTRRSPKRRSPNPVSYVDWGAIVAGAVAAARARLRVA